MWDKGEDHGGYTDDSYDVWVDEQQPYTETVQTGTKTVVTGQRCTVCGATK